MAIAPIRDSFSVSARRLTQVQLGLSALVFLHPSRIMKTAHLFIIFLQHKWDIVKCNDWKVMSFNDIWNLITRIDVGIWWFSRSKFWFKLLLKPTEQKQKCKRRQSSVQNESLFDVFSSFISDVQVKWFKIKSFHDGQRLLHAANTTARIWTSVVWMRHVLYRESYLSSLFHTMFCSSGLHQAASYSKVGWLKHSVR